MLSLIRKVMILGFAFILLGMLITHAYSNLQDGQQPVTSEDYGKWESLGSGVLSPDGGWLVYSIRRNSDENELRLHNLRNNDKRILPNGSGPRFSSDNQWLAYVVNVPAKERKKLEKSKKPIHNKLGLIGLATGDSIVIDDVASFALSGDGRFVAMKRYKPQSQKSKGVDVVVRNLASGTDLNIGNVSEFKWQDEGAVLAMIISAAGKAGNGVQLFDGESESLKLLNSKEALYTGLTWGKKSDNLAVLRSNKNEAYEDSTHVILAWQGLSSRSANASVFDQEQIAGFPADNRIVSSRSLQWSKDGASLFFAIDEWTKKPDKEDTAEADSSRDDSSKTAKRDKDSDEEAPALQIWHSKDVRIIPEQKQRSERNRDDAHLGVWHLKDNRFVQLGDDLTETTRLQYDSPVVVGFDATPYEFEGMFGRGHSDAYAIDIQTGEKKKILSRVNHLYGISPDGKHLAYLKDDQYHIYNFRSAREMKITEGIAASFANQEDDHPVEQKPPYGFIRWAKDSKSFFVHSKYDIWQLWADGSRSRNITNGAGEEIVHRVRRLDPDEETIDPGKPLFVHQFGEWSKKSGYGVITPGKTMKSLVWGDLYASRLIKAKDANTLAFATETFSDSPDYFVTRGDFSRVTQVSDTNPFQKDYAWGKSELIEYQNPNGRRLQGALFYPANYQAGNKYPMITYIYERRSQVVNRYAVPSQRNYYNHGVFTAQGYFVLQPDIVFDAGDPGISSVRTMEIAVQKVVDMGLIDPDRVGLVGHSWGGYQAGFAVTQTDIFAASVAGAGLTDLISMYGMVGWSFGGTPENYHFEVSQERMRVPPWQDLEGYVRNSPVMNVEKLNTPLLFEVGDNDQNVDWRQGIEYYNAARRAGKQMVLLVYANEGHGLRQDKNRIDYHRRILKWFGHYLKGEPAEEWIEQGIPYPEQQRQLKNWKKM